MPFWTSRLQAARSARASRPRALSLAASLAVALAGCGGGTGGDGADARRGCGLEPGRYNVVLISIDTMRADRTSLHGYERPTTPNIDAFFEDGVVFESASTTAPCTSPAVKQYLSGTLAAEGPRLAEVLSEHGYATAAVVSQHVFRWLSPLDRYEAGFQSWDIQAEDEANHHAMSTRTATQVTDGALAWLERRPAERPFFLWLHYYDPHDPYEPPERFDRWPIEGSAMQDGDRRTHLMEAAGEGRPWQFSGAIFSAADRRHFEARYDGEIAFTDAEIGRVFDALAAGGLLESSLVVLTSDHGERLGEQDTWDHCMSLLEIETHVPLALRPPGGAPPDCGRVAHPVSTLDIFPTILSALGIEAEGLALEGHDLLPLEPRPPIVNVFRRMVSVRAGDWKLYGRLSETEVEPVSLVDLATDPLEQTNLIEAHPEAAARLTALANERLEHLAGINRQGEEIVEHLRSLGYTY